MVDHRSNALRRLCLQGTAALLCMAQILVHRVGHDPTAARWAPALRAGGFSQFPYRRVFVPYVRAQPSPLLVCDALTNGAGAGIRIRTSRVALSRAAVKHHARIRPGRSARSAGRRQPARRRASRPGPLAIHVVKERLRSVERGTATCCTTKKNARRTCVDPGVLGRLGLDGRDAGLSRHLRPDRARTDPDRAARACPRQTRNPAARTRGSRARPPIPRGEASGRR